MGADYKNADKHVLEFATGAALPANATRYLGMNNFNANEAAIDFRVPWNCTALRLFCKASAPPGAGETYDYMVRINRGVTTIVCQTAGAVAEISEDILNGQGFVAGDFICIRIVTSLNAVAAQHYCTVGLIT